MNIVDAATGADKQDGPNCDAGLEAFTGRDIDQGSLLGGEGLHGNSRLQLLTYIVKPQFYRAILLWHSAMRGFYSLQFWLCSSHAIATLSPNNQL